MLWGKKKNITNHNMFRMLGEHSEIQNVAVYIRNGQVMFSETHVKSVNGVFLPFLYG